MKILTFHKKSILDADEKLLRTMLASKPCTTLRTVVTAKVKENLAQAAEEALATEPHNAFGDKADGFIKKAKRYQAFLDVLTEVVEQKDPFSVIILD